MREDWLQYSAETKHGAFRVNLSVSFFSVSVPVFSRCSSVASSDNPRSSPVSFVEFQGEMHFRSYMEIVISKRLIGF